MKQHKKAAALCFGVLERNYIQLHDTRCPTVVVVCGLAARTYLLGDCLLTDPFEIDLEGRSDEFEDIESCLTWCRIKEVPCTAAELKNIQHIVDHYTGWPVEIEHLAISESLEVEARPAGWWRTTQLGQLRHTEVDVEAGIRRRHYLFRVDLVPAIKERE